MKLHEYGKWTQYIVRLTDPYFGPGDECIKVQGHLTDDEIKLRHPENSIYIVMRFIHGIIEDEAH